MKIQSLATALSIFPALSVNAAQIAYEGFDLPGGTEVVGSGSGSGWSENWTGSTAVDVHSSGLTYSNAGGTLPTAGNSAINTGGNTQIFRRMSTTVAETPGSSIWVAFIGSQTSSAHLNMALFRNTTEIVSFGQTHSTAGLSPNYSIYKGSGYAAPEPRFDGSTEAADTTGATNLFVMELAFALDGAATAYLYRNPALNSTPDSSESIASVTFTADQDLSFDRVRLENNGTGNIQDELRIGTTFASVVPEPSSALLVLGCFAFAALRRSRRS